MENAPALWLRCIIKPQISNLQFLSKSKIRTVNPNDLNISLHSHLHTSVSVIFTRANFHWGTHYKLVECFGDQGTDMVSLVEIIMEESREWLEQGSHTRCRYTIYIWGSPKIFLAAHWIIIKVGVAQIATPKSPQILYPTHRYYCRVFWYNMQSAL